MTGEAFFHRMIRFVIALGLVSAVFTVGHDVYADDESTGVASTQADSPRDAPLGGPITVPSTSNDSADANASTDVVESDAEWSCLTSASAAAACDLTILA